MQILNPWPGLQARPRINVRSLTIAIPREVAEHFERVYGGCGFTSGCCHTILKAIYDELIRNNIVAYDPDYLLAVVRRLSTAFVASNVAYGNVPGRSESVHCRAAEVPTGGNAKSKGQRAKATKRPRQRKAAEGGRHSESSSD